MRGNLKYEHVEVGRLEKEKVCNRFNSGFKRKFWRDHAQPPSSATVSTAIASNSIMGGDCKQNSITGYDSNYVQIIQGDLSNNSSRGSC